MTAFVNHELPSETRRRVARYIDECPKCYAEYRWQQAIHAELSSQLPAFGRPSSPQLDRIWTGVYRELSAPSAPPARPQSQMRYGMAVLTITLVLMLPMFLKYQGQVAPLTVTQPTPYETLVAAVTDTSEYTHPVTVPTETQSSTAKTEIIAPAIAPTETPAANE
jgi:anti-sigma factor RsiW